MARGVGLAPPPTRQKAPKGSQVSIKHALMVLSRKIKSAGLVFPVPHQPRSAFPSTRYQRAKRTRERGTMNKQQNQSGLVPLKPQRRVR
jgi:hypothetical protein